MDRRLVLLSDMEYANISKSSKKIFYCIQIFAVLLANLQQGVLIYIKVDAFRYTSGGFAIQKCPNHHDNDTFCSTAWKTVSLLGIAYFYEAQILTLIVIFVRSRLLMKKLNSTVNVHKSDAEQVTTCRKRLYLLFCFGGSVTGALKVNIYMFAVIILLVTIKLTIPFITFATIGGFIIPIISTTYDLWNFLISQPPGPKDDVEKDTGG